MKEKELPNYSGALFLSLGSMDLFTQTFFDVSLHFGDSGFGTLSTFVLILCTYYIVFGVFYFVVVVAVDLVCQETYGLHIRKQGNSIGQIVDFDVGEKRFSSF